MKFFGSKTLCEVKNIFNCLLRADLWSRSAGEVDHNQYPGNERTGAREGGAAGCDQTLSAVPPPPPVRNITTTTLFKLCI